MSMTRRRRSSTLASSAALVLGAAACDTSTTEPQGATYAYAEVQAIENPTTRALTTKPFIAFFRASNVGFPNSANVSDQCGVANVADDTPDPNIPGGFSYLEGGSPVTLTLAGPPRTLARTVQARADGAVLFYGLPEQTGGFTPNVDFSISVPGAAGGFPATTVLGHTTVPFTFQPVATGSTGVPLQLRWTAAPSGHASAMLVELQYVGQVSGVNRQLAIYCSLVDDGSHDVAAPTAQGWYEASPSSRSVLFQRLFTTIQQGTGFATVVASTYRATAPTP